MPRLLREKAVVFVNGNDLSIKEFFIILNNARFRDDKTFLHDEERKLIRVFKPIFLEAIFNKEIVMKFRLESENINIALGRKKNIINNKRRR